MSSPKIPTNYTIASTTAVSGSLDMDLDEIRIRELPTIELQSSGQMDVGLDMGLDDIRIRELPTIELRTSMKPTRVHMPVNLKFGLCAMGLELFAFCVCGESMVIVEDYVPRKAEDCD